MRGWNPKRWASGTTPLALFALLSLGLGIAVFRVGMDRFSDYAEAHRRNSVKEKISLVRHALEPLLAEVRAGRLDRAAAIEQARAAVRAFQYEDDTGPNYVFMNAMDGTVLVRPQRPQDEGTRNFVVTTPAGTVGLPWDSLPRLRANPQGLFVSYPWTNPATGSVDEKASFLLLIPELDVMIGTGALQNSSTRAQFLLLRQGGWSALALLVLVAGPFALMLRFTQSQNRRLEDEIRDRQAAQEAQQESEQKVRAILDSSFGFIGLLASDGILLEANGTSLEFAGVGRSEVLGKPFWEGPWWSHSRAEQERLRAAIVTAAGGELVRFETTHPAADGTTRIVDFSLKPVLDQDGKVTLLIPEGRDITEWRNTEAANRLLVANIPGAVYRCEVQPPWRMTYCSEGFLDVLGRPPGDFLEGALTYAEIIHPDDLERVGRTVATGVMEGRIYQLEYRIILPDGGLRWVLERGQEHRGPDGSPLWLDGVILDISALKNAESTLAEKEERLRMVLESTGAGLWDVDFQSGNWAFGQHWSEMLGYRSGELATTAETWPSLVHPEDLPTAEAAVQAHLAGQTPYYECEYRLRHKDGHWVWVHARGLVVARDPDGKPLRFTGSQLDVSERRAIREALELSQATFEAIFRQSKSAIALSTWPNSVCLDVNEAWTESTGIPREEAIGHSAAELGLYVDPNHQLRILDKLMTRGWVKDEEIRQHHRGDGKVRSILYSAQIFTMAGATRLVATGADITDLQRTVESLRASEERFRVLVDHAPEAILLIDVDRVALVDANAKAVELAGCPPWELLGHTGESIARALQPHLTAALGGQEITFEEDLHTKGGEVRKCEVRLVRLPSRDHRLVRGSLTDITERKQTEKALLLKNFVFNASIAGNCISDTGGVITETNAAFLRMMACRAQEDALGCRIGDLFTDPEESLPLLSALESTGVWEGDFNAIRRDGSSFPGHMVATDLKGADGARVGFQCSVLDVTERKRSEQEVRNLKNHLYSIIDSMPSVLVGITLDGTITQWNHQAEATTGIRAAAALGRPIVELLPDFSRWIEPMLEEAVRLNKATAQERLLIEKEGQRNFYDLMLYPLVTDQARGAVVRIEQVTERLHIQELMIQAEKMMSVGGLAAGTAHEINNPLGIISQAAQNIQRRLGQDLPANRLAAEATGLDLALLRAYLEARKIPEFLEGIREAVARATRIVGNMAKFSSTPAVDRIPVQLADIVGQALELAASDYDLKKKYDFKRILVRQEFEPDLPLVPMVATEIEHVVVNLLRNAAQAMAGNPPERPPSLSLRTRKEPPYIVLEVEDNGPGMDDFVRRRVFEPFFTTKDPGVGTGLGLSVSYMIITQNHKGRIEVESEPGHRTRFTIRLPMEPGGEHG